LKEDTEAFERHFKRLAHLKLGQIQRNDLRKIHAGIAGKRAANRVIQLLRRVINWAIKEDLWSGMNPTKGLRLNKEVSRKRFLLPSELPRILPFLKGDLRDFVFLSIQTGARKGNVCSMRWSEIQQLDGQWTWMIPTSKTDDYNIPLLPSVVSCLERRPGAHSVWTPGTTEARFGGTWVFPSCSKRGHVLDFKASWIEARKAAGMPDLRIHDLRRTAGSWMAASGASLPMIGKLLNHESPRSTAIYAKLQLDPIREQLKQAMGLLNG
jgi:integrase